MNMVAGKFDTIASALAAQRSRFWPKHCEVECLRAADVGWKKSAEICLGSTVKLLENEALKKCLELIESGPQCDIAARTHPIMPLRIMEHVE